MGGWRRYRKEKDTINATECIGMTWILQRLRMYGCNLPGTTSANLVLVLLFVMPAFLQQCVWIKTAFLRY
jgi:hypothetical protein